MAPEVIDEAAPRHGLPKNKKGSTAHLCELRQSAEGRRHRSQACRARRPVLQGRACRRCLSRRAARILRRPRSAQHVEPAPEISARRPGHGSAVDRRRSGQGLRGRAASPGESAGARDLRLQPGAHLRRLCVRRRPDRGGAQDRGRPARSRGAHAGRAPVERHADQARNRIRDRAEVEARARHRRQHARRSGERRRSTCATSTTFRHSTRSWAKHFPKAPPATTIITTSTPGFICEAGRIEINTISVRRGGRTKKQVIDAGVPTAFAGHVQAIRAGDLLFLSGLMAVDSSGALASRGAHRSAPAALRQRRAAADGLHARAGAAHLPQSGHLARERRARAAVPYQSGRLQRRRGRSGSSTCRASTCHSRRSKCRRSPCRAPS